MSENENYSTDVFILEHWDIGNDISRMEMKTLLIFIYRIILSNY
ncbi:MAG: hypothetical protein ACTTJ3_07040 [Treponema sp.]